MVCSTLLGLRAVAGRLNEALAGIPFRRDTSDGVHLLLDRPSVGRFLPLAVHCPRYCSIRLDRERYEPSHTDGTANPEGYFPVVPGFRDGGPGPMRAKRYVIRSFFSRQG